MSDIDVTFAPGGNGILVSPCAAPASAPAASAASDASAPSLVPAASSLPAFPTNVTATVPTMGAGIAEALDRVLADSREVEPGSNNNFAAMMVDVGELSLALFNNQSPKVVRRYALQVAAMAIRIAQEGDPLVQAGALPVLPVLPGKESDNG